MGLGLGLIPGGDHRMAATAPRRGVASLDGLHSMGEQGKKMGEVGVGWNGVELP